jgi:putative inorganic carbon (HCO3(-)) transporter
LLEFGIGLTEYAPLAIYIICIIVAILTLVYRVDIGIVAYVFFLPLQNLLMWSAKYPFGKDLNDILLVCMLVGWFIRNRKLDKFKNPFTILLFIFFLWTLFGVYNGTHYIGRSDVISLDNPLFVLWKNYLIPFILFFIIVHNIKTRRQILWILGAMFVAILLLDRNVYNVLHFRDLSHYEATTYVSTSSALSGNYLAMFLAQYAIIFVALFFSDVNEWRKAAYALVVLGSYYCVMFLFCRGAYVGMAISLFCVGLLKERKILVLIFIVLSFWNFLLPTAVLERIEMTKSREGYDSTTMERLYMWEIAKQMIAEKPVQGAGFATTSQMRIKLEDTPYSNYTWRSFHNSYLQTAVELGVLGLGIILWLYLLCFLQGWKLFKMTEDGFIKGLALGFMGSTLAILAGNLTGTTWHLFNISGYYWVLGALVVRGMWSIEGNGEMGEKTNSLGSQQTTQISKKGNESWRRKRRRSRSRTISK